MGVIYLLAYWCHECPVMVHKDIRIYFVFRNSRYCIFQWHTIVWGSIFVENFMETFTIIVKHGSLFRRLNVSNQIPLFCLYIVLYVLISKNPLGDVFFYFLLSLEFSSL